MRPGTTTLRELIQEINAAVEAQATVIVDVDPLGLEVGRSVDDADLPGLNEVVCNEEVLLVWADLDVMGSDYPLVLIWVVEALDVAQVGDVKSSDVIAKSKREVGVLAVVGDVRVDGEVVAGAGTKIEE